MTHFYELWEEVKKLTGSSKGEGFRFQIDTPVPDADLDGALVRGGVKVTLDQVDSKEGVLSKDGRQILLYIPDQGFNALEVLQGNARAGNKFHVADCPTLVQMRVDNRYARYTAVHRFDGLFEIYGHQVQASTSNPKLAKLLVCKNCLIKLNYQESASSSLLRQKVVDNFDINRFLESYSTIFDKAPSENPVLEGDGQYTKNWRELSDQLRQQARWCCSKCDLNLNENRKLLHVHHVNGVKHDNSLPNLRVLCLDCHRREPHHGHLRMTPDDLNVILNLRQHQLEGRTLDWDEILMYSDLSLHGALASAREQGMPAPLFGAPADWSQENVIAFGVHWVNEKLVLAVGRLSTQLPVGWKVLRAERFIEEIKGNNRSRFQ